MKDDTEIVYASAKNPSSKKVEKFCVNVPSNLKIESIQHFVNGAALTKGFIKPIIILGPVHFLKLAKVTNH